MQSPNESSRTGGTRHRFALHPATACLLLALALLLVGLNLHTWSDADWGTLGRPCRWIYLDAFGSVERWQYDFGRLFLDLLVWLNSLVGLASVLENGVLGSRFGAVVSGRCPRYQFSLLTGLVSMVVAAILLWRVVALNDDGPPVQSLWYFQTRGWPFRWHRDYALGPSVSWWRELTADICVCLSILCIVLPSCEAGLKRWRGRTRR